MTNPDIQVNVAALTSYANQLGLYETEADNFGRVIDEADVTNEAWGVIGIWAKEGYTQRLTELRDLLAEMKEGVQNLSTKMTDTALAYQNTEEDTVIRFGQHEAMIDGNGS